MVRRTQTQPQQAMKEQQKGEDQQGQEGSTSSHVPVQRLECCTAQDGTAHVGG